MNAPVENAEVTRQEIVPGVDKYVDMKDCTFGFKKDKIGNKRPTVKGTIPIPSVEGFIRIIENGGKPLELLQDACYDLVRAVVAEDVASNEALKDLSELDMSKYAWEKIATMPKEDRRSSSIPEETWKAFTEDYIKVMPPLTNKSVEAVTNATIVYVKKFVPWKSDKKTIGKLKEQLAIYADQPSAEQFSEILELLVRRADAYLAADDLTLVASNL